MQIPKSCNGVIFESASEFALWLIENVHIMIIPYDDEGKYVRFSMTFIANGEDEEKEDDEQNKWGKTCPTFKKRRPL